MAANTTQQSTPHPLHSAVQQTAMSKPRSLLLTVTLSDISSAGTTFTFFLFLVGGVPLVRAACAAAGWHSCHVMVLTSSSVTISL